MAAIWNEIELGWQGRTYTIRPDLNFMNYIESRDGFSLSKLLIRAINQDLPSGIACELIARTIRYADPEARVTAEDVFMETQGLASAITLAGEIIRACLPAPKAEVNTSAPAAKKKATKRTGRNSTE